MSKHAWSGYQLGVFEALENTGDNLFVSALAGSGKSTVIEECNNRVPMLNDLCMPITVLNAAFNSHIKVALQQKIRRGEVATMNGCGWGIYRNNIPGVILDQFKTSNWLRKQFSRSDEDQKQLKRISATVCRIVSLFKQLNEQTFPENWVKVLDTYGVETGDFTASDGLREWAEKAFEYSINMLAFADFDDQVYQPLRQGWPIKRRDIVFTDECQDLSPVQIALVLELGHRLVSVGDSNQAIYVFRGADIHAIDNLVAATQSKVLPLSICYRCPKEVIRYAQSYVPAIEWADGAIEGAVEDVKIQDFWAMIGDNDYVTCRMTAPLVAKCLETIRMKKKGFVRGRDLGKNLESIITKVKELSPNDSIKEFMIAANDYRTTQVERLTATGRDVEALAIEDKIMTVIELAKDCERVGDISKVIDQVFSDETKEGIEYSTIHKSKGREKERVFRIGEWLCPHKKTPPHLMQIENNLKYVEITRAKKCLYTVLEERNK